MGSAWMLHAIQPYATWEPSLRVGKQNNSMLDFGNALKSPKKKFM